MQKSLSEKLRAPSSVANAASFASAAYGNVPV
jgi:hypothetical protein